MFMRVRGLSLNNYLNALDTVTSVPAGLLGLGGSDSAFCLLKARGDSDLWRAFIVLWSSASPRFTSITFGANLI